MGSGNERNKPCGCGSGLKYKKCHLDRQSQTPLTLNEEFTQLRQAFGARECFHPRAPEECEGKPIDAHTVPRSSLARIAERSHVWGIDIDIAKIIKNECRVGTKLIGISEASTFNGFCAHHDSDPFRPVEDEPARPIHSHALLLAYRAICHETTYLRGRIKATRSPVAEFDRGRAPVTQLRLQSEIIKRERGLNSLLAKLDQNRKLCAALLNSSDSTRIHYWAVELDSPPDVMVCGVCDTRFDFQGRTIPDPSREGVLTVSMIASGERGLALLGWIGEQSASRRFVESIDSLSDEDLPHALLRLAFDKFENRYWSPRWWGTLDERARTSIIIRLQPGRDSMPTVLMYDGQRMVNWKVVQRVRSWS